jgi:hypothetical protein
MKKDALAFFSVANLCSELGFDRFKKQKSFKVAGFYCKFLIQLSYRILVMSPDIVKTLVRKAGFEFVKTSCPQIDPSIQHEEGKNLYYDRDILMILKQFQN